MVLGQNASLGGFLPFSANSLWNTDISTAPVDANSNSIISNYVGSSTHMHPDFGNDPTYGIPYVIVDGNQALATIHLGAYAGDSDPGPMPVPANAPVEGGSSSTGDRHVLVLDNANCFLYELYNAAPGSGGSWSADSTAVWDLLGNETRPYTWTSADAAGLPIFPGLIRYDEAASGNIKHAFRFTLPHTRAAFIPPASHWAANTSDVNAPPMGMRLRLKASYDISGFSAQMQTILTAMKKYGLILADNGSSLYVTGASDNRWGSDLDSLKTVPATAFEVVQMSPIYTASNVPTGLSADHLQFHSHHEFGSRQQRYAFLVRQQRDLCHHQPGAGCGAWHERDRKARSDDDLHFVRNQPVRSRAGNRNRNGSLTRTPLPVCNFRAYNQRKSMQSHRFFIQCWTHSGSLL